MVGYIFDATKGGSPEELARQRAILRALAERAAMGGDSLASGAQALGAGIASKIAAGKANRMEKAGLAEAKLKRGTFKSARATALKALSALQKSLK